MAPYFMSLGEQVDMSQDTSANDLLSDDEDLFDELPSLSVIPVPDILPSHNSLPQLLAQACGRQDYHDATSVQLKVVASQTSLQRLHIYLPHLVELNLTGSHLQSLRILGYGLDRLCILRVGRCALSSLDGLFGVSGLQELYAPHNSISDLGLLGTLPHLRILDLKNNPISSLTQVGFLYLCEELRELTLSDCPVCNLPGYKASVITTLPKLAMLDGLLLAQGGSDLCSSGNHESPDYSDGDDGATALSVESLNIQEMSTAGLGDITPTEPVMCRRPATVSGRRSDRTTLELPDRPATAGPKKKPILLPSITDPEVLPDSVSKLTSGGIVCGNLAAALRGKNRQRKPAWPNQDGGKDNLTHINGLSVKRLYEEVEQNELNGKGGGDSKCNSLLLASQKWREAYHSFRQAHREQWKREEEEEGT